MRRRQHGHWADRRADGERARRDGAPGRCDATGHGAHDGAHDDLPPQTQTEPADVGGDDGGSQQVRVPASFTVTAGGRLSPPTITVPPFLAVEISVRADDGKPHRIVLQTMPRHALQVAAGTRAAVRIPGLRAGRYPVTLDGRRAGALVAGGEVGP